MKMPHRCFVIVPSTMSDLYAQLVTAFADEPQVFVLRDRRKGDRSLEAIGVFAVGGARRRVLAAALTRRPVRAARVSALPSSSFPTGRLRSKASLALRR